jgi:hypothetical protein
MANCNSDYPPNPYIILEGKKYYLEYTVWDKYY